jgi:chromosome segregation ATPase
LSNDKVYLRGAEKLVNDTVKFVNFSSQLVDKYRLLTTTLEKEVESARNDIVQQEQFLAKINAEKVKLESDKTGLEGELGQVKYELAEIQKKQRLLNDSMVNKDLKIKQFEQNPIFQEERKLNQNLTELKNLIETYTPNSYHNIIG